MRAGFCADEPGDPQIGDLFQYLGMLLFDLLSFQGSQTSQLHIENRLSLYLCDPNPPSGGLWRRRHRGIGGISAMISSRWFECDQQTFQDMRALPCLLEFMLAAPRDHLVR